MLQAGAAAGAAAVVRGVTGYACSTRYQGLEGWVGTGSRIGCWVRVQLVPWCRDRIGRRLGGVRSSGNGVHQQAALFRR